MADSELDPNFVVAVNRRGEKQSIPREWLDHPVLGKDFRLPPSATDDRPVSRVTKDDRRSGTKNPAPTPDADKPPVAGEN